MGTIKPKYQIGLGWRRALAALFNELIQKYSDPGWELIFIEPPGANNWVTNRHDMSKRHGDVTRATGDLGLTFKLVLHNTITKARLVQLVELIYHKGTRSNNIQIKATDSVPVLGKVLAFTHERLYIYTWGKSEDPSTPDAFVICSGKRLTIDRLKSTMPKGDKNQVRANFAGLSEPVFRLTPVASIRITTPNELVNKIIDEINYPH